MYPAAELTELARRKVVLRQRIASTRLHCVALAGEAARPVHLFDRLLAQWRRISPLAKLAALPLGLLFRRRLFQRRIGLLPRLVGWLPLVVRGLQLYRSRRATTFAR